jgi:hypothetical protein
MLNKHKMKDGANTILQSGDISTPSMRAIPKNRYTMLLCKQLAEMGKRRDARTSTSYIVRKSETQGNGGYTKENVSRSCSVIFRHARTFTSSTSFSLFLSLSVLNISIDLNVLSPMQPRPEPLKPARVTRVAIDSAILIVIEPVLAIPPILRILVIARLS